MGAIRMRSLRRKDRNNDGAENSGKIRRIERRSKMSDYQSRWCIGVFVFAAGMVLLACSNNNTPTQNANTASAAANQNANKQAAPSPTAANSVYEGAQDLTNCEGVYGWVWDKNQPGNVLSVDIHDGNTPLGTVQANGFRPDLAAAGKGDGRHAFYFPVPPSLKDGRPHSIRVEVSGTGFKLGNSPQSLSCASR